MMPGRARNITPRIWPSDQASPPRSGQANTASSGWVDDLAPPVGAAGRAGHVRELRLVALRAAHQRRRGGLPVRTSRSGVTAGHPPLGNRHVSPPVGRWRRRAGPDVCRCPARSAAAGPPTSGRPPHRAGGLDPCRRAARRTRRTARDSPPGTAVTSAARALPRHGRQVPGRAGRRRGGRAPRRPAPPARRAFVLLMLVVAALGVQVELLEPTVTDEVSGARQRAHSPASGAIAVPVTRTPSDTASNLTSSGTSAPAGTPISSRRRSSGAGTVRVWVSADPA